MKKSLCIAVVLLGFVPLVYAKTIPINWTAPADDKGMPSERPVTAYKLVYSPNVITNANFNNATVIPTGKPKAPGQAESYSVDLPEGKYYFFAVKSVDEYDNWSPISNIAASDFLAPSPVTDLRLQ